MRWALAFLTLLPWALALRLVDASGQEVEVASTARIVTLDLTSTEIVFALGAGARVVARDGSSVYPKEAQALPVVGLMAVPYAVENILAYKPTVVVGRKGLKPDDLRAQLAQAGVPYVEIPAEPGVEATKARIRLLARLLDREAEGEALIRRLEADLAGLTPPAKRLKGLFLYLRGPSLAFVCGEASQTGWMLRLVGAENAAPFPECRPLSASLLGELKPEFLVVLQSGLDSVGGLEGLLNLPGVAETPAGRQKRVIAVAEALTASGGPRLGRAALALFRAIYQEQGFVEVEAW